MSKNDALGEPRTQDGSEAESEADAEPTGESAGETTEPVDLGIGISVDIDIDDVDEDAEHVELEFDENDVLESADESTRNDGDGPRPERAKIGPEEREALAGAGIDPDAVRRKEHSYRLLLDADVDEETADELRRRFSLPWSFDGDGDLERRSNEVRGLGDAEREWIAVSGDEDWQTFEYEHSVPVSVGRERPSERPYPKPTPVTAVTGVGPDDADVLAEAGIRSAERLATIDAMTVARLLDLNVLHVRSWRHNARELLE
ncbi:hypothetical protein [Natrinema salifodinae]|uniref:Helix-hairpin-helix domain-containing protein n=1 Tax=Natrinema salifodinae TaxID=1202768 RepID=A0A1I0NGJ5_9EURY|nr:hypothetical protein [Natrinema salifodinae]SEW00399.1 hypothetical protein SAMN05216285_1699 [Natrinema salifodinae]